MRQSLYRFFIELTNGRVTSYILRKFAQSRLSAWVIPSYTKAFQLQQDEMEKDVKDYRTLHELFTRKLKPNARVIDKTTNGIVSPVDGVLADFGPITTEKEFVIKGKRYSIVDMLGTMERANPYAGGQYMVIYLSPSHYHRMHSPVTAQVRERFTLGRKSYPVNKLGLQYGKDTLSKNYRNVTEMDCDGRRIAMVKVGAMFVNSIELLHERETVQKGEEMAYFTFGSTVVLLFEKDAATFTDALRPEQDVRVGELLGYMN